MKKVKFTLRTPAPHITYSDLATAARCTSMVKICDSGLERFYAWASESALEMSTPDLADFFCLLQEGKQVSTIHNYRSAMGAVHNTLVDDPMLEAVLPSVNSQDITSEFPNQLVLGNL